MTTFSRRTRLQRVPKLTLQLMADNSSSLVWQGKSLSFGAHALTILKLFATPMTLEEALASLPAKSQADWVEITSTIQGLYEAGVLLDADQANEIIAVDASWGHPSIHIAMLNDKKRTASYQKAIREVVHPGDVVVEIGTGSGVLAASAAKSGAAHVYAIEANAAIARVAQATFDKNNLSKQITLLQGWSTQVSLPEKADVLISEIIGNDPFGEGVWENTTDAVRRFLKPEARLIPSHLRVFATALFIPDEEWGKHRVLAEQAVRWQDGYQIDLSSLAQLVPDPGAPLFWIMPQRAKSWRHLSEPILLAEIDLGKPQHMQVNQTNQATAQADGELRGLLVFFELQLSPETSLSTDPLKAEDSNCWYSPVWALEKPLAVRAGEQFTVRYQLNVGGQGSRLEVYPGVNTVVAESASR